MIREPLWPEHLSLLAEYGLVDVPAEALVYLKYRRNEHICHVDDPMPYFMIVAEGRVKVVNTIADGKSFLLCFYQKGGIMGDMELLTGRSACSMVQAETDVECIGISIALYGEELRKNVIFLNRIAEGLVEKLYTSSVYSTHNLLIPLEYRLCKYIYLRNEDGYFYEKLTVLSELFGCSYRHLTRVIKKLCEEGVLEKENKKIVIKNKKVLMEYASRCQ